MSKKNPFNNNKYEIMYELINACLFGASTFISSILKGNIGRDDFILAFVISTGVMIFRLQTYWSSQKKEYKKFMFRII
jgi:hypothetical protein